jgi:hypothetical protein
MGVRRREWVFILAGGVYWGIAIYLGGLGIPSGPREARFGVLTFLLDVFSGLVLTAVLVVMGRDRIDRRFVVDGRPASGSERAAALAAIRSGHLPADPRERQAAISFLRYRLSATFSPWTIGALLGCVVASMEVLAILDDRPSSLLGTALICLWASPVIVIVLRWRQRARALLMSIPQENGQVGP